jgi:hypothetical protein
MSLFEQENSFQIKDQLCRDASRPRPGQSGPNLSPTDQSDRVDPAIRLNELIAEHDDLDQAVASMLCNTGCDDLAIIRLKKRKLHLKDEIVCAQLRFGRYSP